MAATQFKATDKPSGLTEFVLFLGHGVKGLSNMGLKTLPEQYVQPLEERPSSFKIVPDHQQSIPIIEVATWEDPEVADSICDAAEKYGFFQVENHGVPLQVLENVKAATYRFFELPAKEKMKYLKGKSPSNDVNGSSYSPEADKALEWKDYLSLFFVSEGEAASTWPPACRYMYNIFIQGSMTLEYMKKTEIVIRRFMQVLMKRLNVKQIDETKESFLMGSKRTNLNYYPICPNPLMAVAIGRHSDISTLTILLQDETGGLYSRANDGEQWIRVPPVSSTLVINIGDEMQIMSNGRYKRVEHRVNANGSKVRVSMPLFVNPRPSDVIGPWPEVVASGEKALYKNVLYSDHVNFFRKAHDGKQTVKFAKSRQKSYTDKRRRLLEFEVRDHVFLRVSPVTGIGRSIKAKKLTPRFMDSYEILERIGPALKKYNPDPFHVIELKEVELGENLTFRSEPDRIEDFKEKQLRNKTIRLVKVIWKGAALGDATWETEENMRRDYSQLFA
ncbi:feruloyl CoA ortho-hydroxylase F6H1-3-like [Prosopis cineraria]|uniref:feruloyl CoA ortho-hydroxylase F6H1-3-like n=1 Tax=Prosopis cineraria TaxID=364024 RepID=UPI00240E9C91|nr:feruloyl CoA ortho-hydroxylase F6H1-3-like [Prosopis cineraria]